MITIENKGIKVGCGYCFDHMEKIAGVTTT